MSKLKKGLTYISERTNQIRYSDKNTYEQWLQPLAIYKAKEKIKRGQPVSVASQQPGDESSVYVELTNPLNHTSSVGLALEYAEVGQVVHVIDAGQFILNIDYYKKASLSQILDNVIKEIKTKEYTPEFLFDESNIGKPIFVKGNIKGELTVVPEEAYLAHNNIIQVGFVADTFNKNAITEDLKTKEKTIDYEKLQETSAVISLQFEGDSRGPIDHTQFEVELGEDISVIEGKPIALALGNEDAKKLEFNFGLRQPVGKDLPTNGFIVLKNNSNGKIAYIQTENDQQKLPTKQTDISSENYPDLTLEDRRYLHSILASGTVVEPIIQINPGADLTASGVLAKTIEALTNAFNTTKEITENTLVHNTDDDIISETTAYTKLIASIEEGYFDIYISDHYNSTFEVPNFINHGSFENKGKAVLADIRNANRQNLIGVYLPEKTTTLKATHRVIVTYLGTVESSIEGLYKDENLGKPLYLFTNGTLTTFAQDYYNSVLRVGYIETNKRIFVSCDSARKYWDGELPVGYMKPTVHGEAEWGFAVMDGVTHLPYETYKNLYEVLKPSLGSKLEVLPEKNGDLYFVLPKLVYDATYETDAKEVKNEYAQVKYINHGIYVKAPAHPVIQHEDTLLKKKGENIPKFSSIDITGLMNFSPIGEDLRTYSEHDISIRIFVDCRKQRLDNTRVWTELRPGFKIFNNFDYYGFEYRIERGTKDSTKWFVNFYNNISDSENGAIPHGPMIERDPFEPPVSIEGMPYKVIIERHPLWQSQFDFEGLFDHLVDQNVMSVDTAKPTLNAVSGNAIQKYIKDGVDTDHLVIGKEGNNSDLNIKITNDSKITIGSPNPLTFVGDIKYLASDKEVEGTLAIIYKDGKEGLYKYNSITNRYDPLYKKNEKGEIEIADKDNPVVYSENEFIPKYLLTKHEETYIDNPNPLAEEDNKYKDHIHGIINDGLRGNLNAISLNGMQVGTPTDEFKADIIENYKRKRIPFMYELPEAKVNKKDEEANNDFKYTINLPTFVSFTSRNPDLTNTTPLALKAKKGSVDLNILTTENSDKQNIFKLGINGDKGTPFDIEFNYTTGTYSITHNGKKIQADIGSTIKIKSLNTEFINNNGTNIKLKSANEFFKDHKVTPETHTDSQKLPLLQNALQAAAFIPTSAFHYLSENEDVKRWFGIITERIADTKEALSKTEKVTGDIGKFDKVGKFNPFEDLEYCFTPDEIESIKAYLNLITNENDTAQNILSTVGILIEAAKETQMRLLPNEASIYGADANTIPGDRVDLNENAPSYATSTPTHLGLNRLVKALCAEIFLDADPTEIIEGSGEGPDAHRYSRLDEVYKAIYGKDSAHPDEGQTGNKIELEKNGSTYVKTDDDLSNFDRAAYDVETKTNPITSENKPSGQELEQFEVNNWTQGTSLKSDKTDEVDKGVQAIAEFDGTNDAINRIVRKLNRLTAEIHDVDNINTSAVALDRIRLNIETLLQEVYSTTYKDDSKTPFAKSGLSRLDLLTKELFDIKLNLGSNKNLSVKGSDKSSTSDFTQIGETAEYKSNKTFNGKPLKGQYHIKNASLQEDSVDSFIAKIPEKVEDFDAATTHWANIIDIIIDIIGDNLDDILRENNINAESYQEKRPSKTILARIKMLEDQFDKVVKYFNVEETDFERTKDQSYSNIHDINTLVAWITEFLGITYTSKGWTITNQVLEEADKTLNDLKQGSIAAKGLYSTLINISRRLTVEEAHTERIDARLGNYYGPNKENSDILPTLSSDMLFTERLLYGEGKGTTDKDFAITYNPRNVEKNQELYNENDESSKVLDTLYASLYTLPTRYSKDASENVNQIEGTGKNDQNSTTRYLLEDNNSEIKRSPNVPKNDSKDSVALNRLLTTDVREALINQASVKQLRRFNRFEAIEDQLLALRKMTFGPLTKDSNTENHILDKNLILKDLRTSGKNLTASLEIDKVNFENEYPFGEGYIHFNEYTNNNFETIKNLGGVPFSGAHKVPKNDQLPEELTSSAIGIAATAFNIADKNHAAISQLLNATLNDTRKDEEKHIDETENSTDSLIVRIKKLRQEIYNSDELPGTDKASYEENYEEYGIRNRLALAEKRLHDIENDDTGDDARIAKLQENLGTNAEGKWLAEGEVYNKSLKGQHDTLDALVGEFSNPKTIYLDLKKSFPDGLWGSGGGHVILSTDKECADDNILLATSSPQKFTGRKPISELATLLRTDKPLGAESKHGYVASSTLVKGTTDVLKITLADSYFNKSIPQKIEGNKIYFSVIESWTPGNGRPAPIDISYAGEEPDTTVCKEIEALKAEVGKKSLGKEGTLNSRVDQLESSQGNAEAYSTSAREALGESYYDYKKDEKQPEPVDQRLEDLEKTVGNKDNTGLVNDVTTLKESISTHTSYKITEKNTETATTTKTISSTHKDLNLKVIGEDYFQPDNWDSHKNGQWEEKKKSKTTISKRLNDLEANTKDERLIRSSWIENSDYPYIDQRVRVALQNTYMYANDNFDRIGIISNDIGNKTEHVDIKFITAELEAFHQETKYDLSGIDTNTDTGANATILSMLKWVQTELDNIENGTSPKLESPKVGGIGIYLSEWENDKGHTNISSERDKKTLWDIVAAIDGSVTANITELANIKRFIGDSYYIATEGTALPAIDTRLGKIEAGNLGKPSDESYSPDNENTLWKQYEATAETVVEYGESIGEWVAKDGDWKATDITAAINNLYDDAAPDSLQAKLTNFFASLIPGSKVTPYYENTESSRSIAFTITTKENKSFTLQSVVSTGHETLDANTLYYQLTGRHYYKSLKYDLTKTSEKPNGTIYERTSTNSLPGVYTLDNNGKKVDHKFTVNLNTFHLEVENSSGVITSYGLQKALDGTPPIEIITASVIE